MLALADCRAPLLVGGDVLRAGFCAIVAGVATNVAAHAYAIVSEV
jgi:hypothetical protein